MTIEDRLEHIIRRLMGPLCEKLTPTARFDIDLGFDSLDFVEFVMDVEQEFKIEVSEEDAEGWRKLGDVLMYLKHSRWEVDNHEILVPGQATTAAQATAALHKRPAVDRLQQAGTTGGN